MGTPFYAGKILRLVPSMTIDSAIIQLETSTDYKITEMFSKSPVPKV
jgi:hypothetical protein